MIIMGIPTPGHRDIEDASPDIFRETPRERMAPLTRREMREINRDKKDARVAIGVKILCDHRVANNHANQCYSPPRGVCNK